MISSSQRIQPKVNVTTITIRYTDISISGLEKIIDIYSCEENEFIQSIYIDVDTVWNNIDTCVASIGTSDDDDSILTSSDITTLGRYKNKGVEYNGDYDTTTILKLKVVATQDNLDQATTGELKIYIKTIKY